MSRFFSRFSRGDKTQEFARFIEVLILLLVFIMAARTPIDTDMWWHLQAGKLSVQNTQPLTTDLFSFTRAGSNWVNHSWLAEASMYLVYQVGNYWGLGVWMALLVTITLAFTYHQMNGAPLYKAFWLILGVTVMFWVWSPRPQLYSLLLFAILISILESSETKPQRLRWLPLIFCLWSNLHGGYVLGFLLLFLWVAGKGIDFIRFAEGSLSAFWQEAKPYFIWGGVSLLSVLINPNGIQTWLIPFKTVGVKVLQTLIDEWASPDFHVLALQPFLIFISVLWLVMVLSPRKVRGFDLLGTVILTVMSLMAKRNFGPLVLFALPVGARYGWPIVQNLNNRLVDWREHRNKPSRQPKQIPDGVRRVVNLLIVAGLAVIAVIKAYTVAQPIMVEGYIAQSYPTGALNYLAERDFSGNLFNAYGWGGYIDWTMPQIKVFVDGRTDLFGDEILSDYLTFLYAQPNWQVIPDRWDFHWVLVEPEAPLADQLRAAGWRTVYQDPVSVLLTQE